MTRGDFPISMPSDLQPLQQAKKDVKTSREHTREICERNVSKCKYPWYYTKHSIRATTATKLFQEGVDEQLIMSRTGHRSVEGKLYEFLH